jgi:hypothetical protein
LSGESPGVTEATSRTAFELAGITAPLLPLIGESMVATILSPGRFVVVQTFPPEVTEKPVPLPISFEGAGAGAGLGLGIGADGTGCGVASEGAWAGLMFRSRRDVPRDGVGRGVFSAVGFGSGAFEVELSAVSSNVG